MAGHGRAARLRGAALAALGVAAVLFISVIHGNKGSGHGLQAYAYLAAPGSAGALSLPVLAKGLATHPATVAAKLWSKRIDLWANLAPSGLLGLAYLPLLPLIAVVILANDLFRGFLFSEPLFQSLPIYVLLPAGTVAVLAWVTARRRRLGLLLAGAGGGPGGLLGHRLGAAHPGPVAAGAAGDGSHPGLAAGAHPRPPPCSPRRAWWAASPPGSTSAR